MAPSWMSGLLMPEEQAFAARAPLILPDHSVRGMFLESACEYLRRAKGEDTLAAVKKAAGFEPSTEWGAMKKVPLEDFNRLRMHICRAFMPEVASIEEASSKVGQSAVEIFFESVAGRTMILLAGKNPHRLFGAAPNGYGLAVEDGAVRAYEKIGENEGVFTFKHDLLGPCHQLGVFSSAIQVVCNKTITVAIEQSSVADFVFRITW